MTAARTSFVIMVAFLLTGCGMMFGGTTDSVTIKSVPPGLRIVVDGDEKKAPVVIEMGRNRNHSVIFPDGQEVRIKQLPNYWSLINLTWIWDPLMMIIWFIVDSFYKDLEPDNIEYRDGKVYDMDTGKVIRTIRKTPPLTVHDSRPVQAKHVWALLAAVRDNKIDDFKKVWTKERTEEFEKAGWDKTLERFRSSVNKHLGDDFKIDDFEFTFEGDNSRGRVGIAFKGKQLPKMDVAFDESRWDWLVAEK